VKALWNIRNPPPIRIGKMEVLIWKGNAREIVPNIFGNPIRQPPPTRIERKKMVIWENVGERKTPNGIRGPVVKI
jgi:hypothetical protein